ncbi:MAG: molecular chaperone [Desulfovibrionaceae bacterium]|nr:MAG: molecular chaperone [Desulfovibrionaceae bacterium]
MTLESDTNKAPDAPAEEAKPLTPEEEIAQLKREVAAEADKRLRTLAETDNLKKRLIREKEEFVKFAAEGVLSDLLPVLDNLDLALAHGRTVAACKDVVMGVDMTRKVFLDTLARHGLEVCGTVGEEFNPEVHEAVGMQPAGPGCEVAPNHVMQVMQAGYRLRGRLLRPAKVLVCQG